MIENTLRMLIYAISLLTLRRTERAWNPISPGRKCSKCGKSRFWNTTKQSQSLIKTWKIWILEPVSERGTNCLHKNIPQMRTNSDLSYSKSYHYSITGSHEEYFQAACLFIHLNFVGYKTLSAPRFRYAPSRSRAFAKCP